MYVHCSANGTILATPTHNACICLVSIMLLTCYPSLAVGQDFILSRTEVTFALGTNDGNVISVSVDILDDLLVEGMENFTLTGSVAPPALFVGGPVTVTIIDNDGKDL